MSTYEFEQLAFINALKGTTLQRFAQLLSEAVLAQGHALKHGHLDGWHAAVQGLQASAPCDVSIIDGAITISCEDLPNENLHGALQALMPWRKGPFHFGPVRIDTEWRSDWKWNRLAPHISSLNGRTVLDVGCGSGYHLWRMRLEGASLVLGIDPSLLYVKQFEAAQHFIQDQSVHLLPLPMEALPAKMQVFDTVFSMGVLYHRRDPHSHLQELREAMVQQGELVMETLVVPGEGDDSLIIDGRYANMRNIYELPTVQRLCRWMEQAGFTALNVADVSVTSRTEQRATSWMTSHSLAQALDDKFPELGANVPEKTIEGHPRPLRAIVVARMD